MPRHHFAILAITATLLTATAACAAGAAAPAAAPGGIRQAALRTSSPATPTTSTKPAQPIDVLSVSFATPSTGWLLAEPACAHLVSPCRTTVLMRKTVNGGRTWFAVPAPPARPADMFQSSPPAGAVGRVLFTSARDGWAVGRALWQTTNGGDSWQRVPVPGPVADFTVAGRRMLAVVGGCNSAGRCAYRGYTAEVGARAWRPLPGTAISGPYAASVQLAVSGSVGYLLAISGGRGKPTLLAGPVTGSGRWRARPEPCAAVFSGALAAAGRWLLLGCGGEPGAGNQLKTAYRSSDGGRQWRRVASPSFNGYLGSASMSAGGTVFLTGQRMDVDISADRGGSWHQSPSLDGPAGGADAGFPLLAVTVTDTFGVAIEQGVTTRQVWLTRDGGARWAPVTVG